MLILLATGEYPKNQEQLDALALQEPERWPAFLDRIANILKERTHAVWASPALLALLAEAPQLNPIQQRAVGETIARIQDRSFDQEATVALVLTGPNGAKKNGRFQGDSIRRDWTWLAEWQGSLSKGVLLAEDLSDAQLLHWLGRAWGTRLDPTGAHAGEEVNLACESGGGQNTPLIFHAKVVQGHPTLCIVDGDLHPSGSEGNIAKAARDRHRKLSSDRSLAPSGVGVLDAYTIENLCPWGVLEKVHESKGFIWLKPMVTRGFFAQPLVDPKLSFVNPCKNQSAAELLEGQTGDALKRVQRAIETMRERDPKAPKDDASPLVLGVGKLPKCVVERLEQANLPTDRPTNTRSSADWLRLTLTHDTGNMDDRLKAPAQLVWSWGLHYPARIAAR